MTAERGLRLSMVVPLVLLLLGIIIGWPVWLLAIYAVALLIRYRTGWEPPDRWSRGAETVGLVLIVAAVAYMLYTVVVIFG